VSLPAGWSARQQSIGDHTTYWWTDPSDPFRRIEVVISGCYGCARDSAGNPAPVMVVPPNSSVSAISRIKVGFVDYSTDDPYPGNGIVVVPTGTNLGYALVELWLPDNEHATATTILNSFVVPV
jgi:hypothetical protein